MMKLDFEKKKEGQLNNLKHEVMNGNNTGFYVSDIEAGLGKTLTVEKALIELYAEKPNMKTLLVKKFSDVPNYKGCRDWQDCVEIDGNTSSGRINIESQLRFKKKIAISIDSSNYENNRKDIKNYPVVIITHEMYMQLWKSPSKMKKFTEGRQNLIIDEEVDVVKELKYDTNRISFFKMILPEQLVSLYDESIAEIKALLSESKEKTFVNLKLDSKIDGNLSRLKKIINKEVTKQHIDSIKDEIFREFKKVITKTCYIEEIEVIREFYKNTAILDSDKLYTFDGRLQYWFLENNIMLDANAGFHYGYELSDKFKVHRHTRIVDHSRWNVNICDVNTTKNGKKKYTNFHDIITKHIEENEKKGDEILIIGNKDDCDKIHAENIDKAYFGNIIGKNNWREFNKLYVVHTPNIPFHTYILKFLYYSGKRFNGRNKHNMITKEGVFTFENKELDKVRKKYVAGELYQAIKRIDREVNKEDVQIYIFNNDKEVISKVLKQIKNVNVNNFSVDVKIIKKERKQYDSLNRQKDSFQLKFIELLKNLKTGTYSKKWCREQIGYKNKNNFAKHVLDNDIVVEFLRNNSQIIIGRTYIEVEVNGGGG